MPGIASALGETRRAGAVDRRRLTLHELPRFGKPPYGLTWFFVLIRPGSSDWQLRDQIMPEGGGGAGTAADRNAILTIEWPRPGATST